MGAATVLVVDDEVLFTELLCRTLAAEPGVDVVGTAHDGDDAIRIANQTKPDVVLMDIELQGSVDGIQAAQQIQQIRPGTGIVLLSAHHNRRFLSSLPAGEIGGWSYLLKQSVPDVATLVRAIQGSHSGMVVLDPQVVEDLRPRKGSALSRLTPRQLEVLALIAQGYNNSAIAKSLVITEKSVETYIGVIYQHLQVSGSADTHARVKATLVYLQESQTRPAGSKARN